MSAGGGSSGSSCKAARQGPRQAASSVQSTHTRTGGKDGFQVFKRNRGFGSRVCIWLLATSRLWSMKESASKGKGCDGGGGLRVGVADLMA